MTDKRQEKPEENSSSGIFWGEHEYTVRSRPMCNANSERGCSIEYVNKVMLSRKSHVTPTNLNEPVKSGETTKISGLGTVKHTVNQDKSSVTNTTQSDHILHPGTVERRVQQEPNGDVIIVTKGSGDGLLPAVNVKLAPHVWNGPDERLREAVQEGLKRKEDS